MTEAVRHWFHERFRTFGDATAIVDRDGTYTYADLVRAWDRGAAFLAAGGVKPGGVVAILSDFSFDAVAMFLALLENRNVLVPITVAGEDEIADRYKEGQVDLAVKPEGGEPRIVFKAEAAPEKHNLIRELQDAGKAGLLLFSSGTTGKPKAMIHDLDQLLETFRDKKPKAMVMMAFLMFDHIGGLNTIFNALAMGATAVLCDSRDAEHVASLIETHKVQLLPTSPTFLNLLLMADAPSRFNLSSLRIVTYGTESMPEALLLRLKDAFPKTKFMQSFGTSETGISQTFTKSSVSTLLKLNDPNCEYKVVGGELWLRSKTQIKGYLNYPMDSFTEDGWFRTGDLVEETEDGYLRIVGRLKEQINVGGQKVLPMEVESLILELPEVADCMVYGAPNAITGQMVVAEVVPAPGADSASLKLRVQKHCIERADRYKAPSKVVVKDRIAFGQRFKRKRPAE